MPIDIGELHLDFIRSPGYADFDNWTTIARKVIASGWLQETIEHLNLSWRMTARMMAVDVPTLRAWVTGKQTPTTQSLAKIYVFWREIERIFDQYPEEFWENIMPIRHLCRIQGRPESYVLKDCEDGKLHCHDLGLLGVWVDASEQEMERWRRAQESDRRKVKS